MTKYSPDSTENRGSLFYFPQFPLQLVQLPPLGQPMQLPPFFLER